MGSSPSLGCRSSTLAVLLTAIIATFFDSCIADRHSGYSSTSLFSTRPGDAHVPISGESIKESFQQQHYRVHPRLERRTHLRQKRGIFRDPSATFENFMNENLYGGIRSEAFVERPMAKNNLKDLLSGRSTASDLEKHFAGRLFNFGGSSSSSLSEHQLEDVQRATPVSSISPSRSASAKFSVTRRDPGFAIRGHQRRYFEQQQQHQGPMKMMTDFDIDSLDSESKPRNALQHQEDNREHQQQPSDYSAIAAVDAAGGENANQQQQQLSESSSKEIDETEDGRYRRVDKVDKDDSSRIIVGASNNNAGDAAGDFARPSSKVTDADGNVVADDATMLTKDDNFDDAGLRGSRRKMLASASPLMEGADAEETYHAFVKKLKVFLAIFSRVLYAMDAEDEFRDKFLGAAQIDSRLTRRADRMLPQYGGRGHRGLQYMIIKAANANGNKRSHECMRKCLRQKLLHPAQCHTLC